jgi:hypothetical protein
MRIRIERERCDVYLLACRSQDRQASNVLREFTHLFTDRQAGGQADPPGQERRDAA